MKKEWRDESFDNTQSATEFLNQLADVGLKPDQIKVTCNDNYVFVFYYHTNRV